MRSRPASKTGAIIVLFAFFFSVFNASTLHANMLPTGSVIESEAQETRESLIRMLEKDEVQNALESRGVSASEARERVDSMTVAELHQAANQIDNLPSGEGGLSLLGLLVVILILVLILR